MKYRWGCERATPLLVIPTPSRLLWAFKESLPFPLSWFRRMNDGITIVLKTLILKDEWRKHLFVGSSFVLVIGGSSMIALRVLRAIPGTMMECAVRGASAVRFPRRIVPNGYAGTALRALYSSSRKQSSRIQKQQASFSQARDNSESIDPSLLSIEEACNLLRSRDLSIPDVGFRHLPLWLGRASSSFDGLSKRC